MIGIGAGEGLVVAIVVVAIAAQIGLVIALAVWGRRVARARGGGPWNAVAWAPLVGLALQILGACVTAGLVVRTFSALASADAAERASALARGIAESMNVGAALGTVALLLYVASLVALVIGTVLSRRDRGTTPRET